MWRSRITHKIGAIYGIGILGLLIVAGIYSVGLSTQGQYKRVANDATAIVELANKLRVELLESRMTEKEFLLRKDMKYASHHAELARTIDANFDTIGDRIANARQNDLIPQINAIHDGFEKYVTDFATLAEAKRRLGLDENSGIEGQLRNSVHEIESTLNEFNEQSLLVTMLMMRRHEKDFMLRRDLRYGDDMKKRAVEFTAGLAAASIPDAIKATMAEKLAAYQSDFFAWMDGAVTVANTQEATSDVYSAIEPRIDAFLKSVEQVSAAATASNDAARAATNMQMEIAILLMIVAVSAFGFLIGRSVSGPLTTITTALAELANGNKSVEILFTDRSDEIGDNARAAKNFRDNLVRMEKLEAQQKEREVRAATERKTAEEREAAERRAAAEQEEAAQKAATHKLANEFEAAVGSIIETVSSASIELEAAADTLTKIAHTTQRLSTVVASASDEASTNVQSVASATEEGASSLQEISRQLQESSKVANNAAKQAARTDADVSKLSNAAQRIGDVVKLIATVAEQTNLLALNATIEAARAGEAGKGFAVVAQEVKALAAMTAKAAEEIRAQITGIQVATQESVTAITEIGGTIGWISEIATATVARMEKQGTATREIVRNVREAAKCTAQVAVNITDVNRGAIETGSASARLLSSAQVLANESNRLKAEVGKFLNTVRAA